MSDLFQSDDEEKGEESKAKDLIALLNEAIGGDFIATILDIQKHVVEMRRLLDTRQGEVQDVTQTGAYVMPSIKKEQFSGAIAPELMNSDWSDMVKFGSGKLRLKWVEWMGNIVQHRAMIPYWSRGTPSEAAKDMKEAIFHKVSKCVLSIMVTALQMTFPKDKVGYKNNNGILIKGTDRPMLVQVFDVNISQ